MTAPPPIQGADGCEGDEQDDASAARRAARSPDRWLVSGEAASTLLAGVSNERDVDAMFAEMKGLDRADWPMSATSMSDRDQVTFHTLPHNV